MHASPSSSEKHPSSCYTTPVRPLQIEGTLRTSERAHAAQDDVDSLAQRWGSLSQTNAGHAQAAAKLLVLQAGAAAQVEDLVVQLLRLLGQREEEKRRLEAQVLQDRSDFTSQAKLLSQHFTLSHHRNTALQVAHESLQAEVRASQEQVQAAQNENRMLRQQLAALQEELKREHNERMQADAALQEHGVAIEEMQQELQQSRSCCEDLAAAKAQLQSQVKAMVTAERELTESLKHTHAQIDEQLNLLREQLQMERQRRMLANRRKVELAQQVTVLTAELEACRESLLQRLEVGAEGNGAPAAGSVGKQLRQALVASKLAPASLRSSLMRRTKAIKVALPASHGNSSPIPRAKLPLPQPGTYTAAFAPPAAITPKSAGRPAPDIGGRASRASVSPHSAAAVATGQGAQLAAAGGGPPSPSELVATAIAELEAFKGAGNASSRVPSASRPVLNEGAPQQSERICSPQGEGAAV